MKYKSRQLNTLRVLLRIWVYILQEAEFKLGNHSFLSLL